MCMHIIFCCHVSPQHHPQAFLCGSLSLLPFISAGSPGCISEHGRYSHCTPTPCTLPLSMGLHGLNCTEGEDNGTESSAVGECAERDGRCARGFGHTEMWDRQKSEKQLFGRLLPPPPAQPCVSDCAPHSAFRNPQFFLIIHVFIKVKAYSYHPGILHVFPLWHKAPASATATFWKDIHPAIRTTGESLHPHGCHSAV